MKIEFENRHGSYSEAISRYATTVRFKLRAMPAAQMRFFGEKHPVQDQEQPDHRIAAGMAPVASPRAARPRHTPSAAIGPATAVQPRQGRADLCANNPAAGERTA